MRRHQLIYPLLLLALLAAVGLSLYSAPNVFGQMVRSLPDDERIVALSFDDGPRDPDTLALLEVLERHQAPATFFMTGRAAAEHTELVRAVVAAGHGVGNHSWSHPRFVLQGPLRARRELDRTDAVLREAGVKGPIHFRSPFGKKGLGLQWALWRSGRVNVLFDVMPTDYLSPGVDEIVDQVMSEVHPGAIVVMHDGGGDRSQTVEAVDRLIPLLRAEGYRLVGLEEVAL